MGSILLLWDDVDILILISGLEGFPHISNLAKLIARKKTPAIAVGRETPRKELLKKLEVLALL